MCYAWLESELSVSEGMCADRCVKKYMEVRNNPSSRVPRLCQIRVCLADVSLFLDI